MNKKAKKIIENNEKVISNLIRQQGHATYPHIEGLMHRRTFRITLEQMVEDLERFTDRYRFILHQFCDSDEEYFDDLAGFVRIVLDNTEQIDDEFFDSEDMGEPIEDDDDEPTD